MSAPTTSPDTPDRSPYPTESLSDTVPSPLLLHTPGPIPPVDDDDDDEDDDDDSKGGGKGGNIDPDDDEDLDDEEDDDDEADKQWASRRDALAGVADARFVLQSQLYGVALAAFALAYDCPPRFGKHVSARNSGNPIIGF